jgi:hypothetical protein
MSSSFSPELPLSPYAGSGKCGGLALGVVGAAGGRAGSVPLGLRRPVAFASEVLGQTLWHKQTEALQALVEGGRVTIRSSHGVGKTFLEAAASLWRVYSHRPSLVLTTAPTQRQVEGLLWGEINRLWRQANCTVPNSHAIAETASTTHQHQTTRSQK